MACILRIFDNLDHTMYYDNALTIVDQNLTNSWFLTFQVLVKRIPKSEVYMTRDILVEIKQCRDVNHANLCRFVGRLSDLSLEV